MSNPEERQRLQEWLRSWQSEPGLAGLRDATRSPNCRPRSRNRASSSGRRSRPCSPKRELPSLVGRTSPCHSRVADSRPTLEEGRRGFAARQLPHQPGNARALGLRAHGDDFAITTQTAPSWEFQTMLFQSFPQWWGESAQTGVPEPAESRHADGTFRALTFSRTELCSAPCSSRAR